MRRTARLSLCAALAALLSVPALAQQHEHTGAGAHADDRGTGTLSFPTSTHSSEAQAAFERGMRWLHLFEYEDAQKAFVAAQRLDPDFALAYWGEAMTHTNGIWNMDEADAARAALARLAPTRAERAAKTPTAREKAFLDTGEQLFSDGTVDERRARFVASAKALVAQFPDDDEARLLYALALFDADPKGRNDANYAESAKLSRSVLEHNPRHAGAAHYLIHAVDDPAHAAEGLDAARTLHDMGPASSHAQHMTSHIFFGLGRWDDAIAANLEAIRLEEDARKQMHLPPARCGHATDWLQYAYYQTGRVHEARQALADCISDNGALIARRMMLGEDPEKTTQVQFMLLDSLIDLHSTALVEAGRDAARDAAYRIDTGGNGRFSGHELFARGYVAALSEDFADARNLLAQVRAAAAQPPVDAELEQHLGEQLTIEADMLEALIDAGEHRSEAAIARARAAATRSDAMPFQFGPPQTVKPPHELVGDLLLRADRPREALAEYDLASKTTPNRALSLLGRARALKAMGETAAARDAFAQLAAQWHGADADLAALAEVRAGAGTGDVAAK